MGSRMFPSITFKSSVFPFITRMTEKKYARKKSGYVHRSVMEKHLGRQLESGEVVHHINCDPSDNRIENLKLFKDDREHHIDHWNQGTYKRLREPKISEAKRQKITEMTKKGHPYSEIVKETGISYNIVKKYALKAGVKSRYSDIDDPTKKRILELLNEGKTYRFIAKEFDISIGSISRLIKRGEIDFSPIYRKTLREARQ